MTVTADIAAPPQLLYKVADLVAVLRMSRAYIYKQIKACDWKPSRKVTQRLSPPMTLLRTSRS